MYYCRKGDKDSVDYRHKLSNAVDATHVETVSSLQFLLANKGFCFLRYTMTSIDLHHQDKLSADNTTSGPRKLFTYLQQ